MNHILCPGCDTIMPITEFPCPDCGRCAGCGRWSNPIAQDCTNCRHPNDEEILQRLLIKFGIPEPSIAEARRYASNLRRLRRAHTISFRIAVAVGSVLILCFLDAVRDAGLFGFIVIMLITVLFIGSLGLTFGVLEFLQRRAIRSPRGSN